MVFCLNVLSSAVKVKHIIETRDTTTTTKNYELLKAPKRTNWNHLNHQEMVANLVDRGGDKIMEAAVLLLCVFLGFRERKEVFMCISYVSVMRRNLNPISKSCFILTIFPWIETKVNFYINCVSKYNFWLIVVILTDFLLACSMLFRRGILGIDRKLSFSHSPLTIFAL